MAEGQKGHAQPGCGIQLGIGPCKELLPEMVQHRGAAVVAPQAAPCSVARKGVPCVTHLHRSPPGRSKSVHLKNTLFFSCDNKCSSPAWTLADPASSSARAKLLGAGSTCGVLGASHSSQRRLPHPVLWLRADFSCSHF